MSLPGRPGPRLEAIYAALGDDEKKVVAQALIDSPLTAEAISAVLTQNGHTVSASTIRTYRRALRREGVPSV
ncbi:hypothetical protein ACFU6R_03360 [Streptomyces sp. NPDC057499]|uniref:hypothetical protein n=1 Tax=Streptomyces sp. NPDC057499 TaxID=3346150 RepID=UPI0036ACB545